MYCMKKWILSILILASSRPVMACSININPVAETVESLSLVSKHTQVKPIANVAESCDEPSGYVVSISSLNSSKLKSSAVGYSYQISYDSEIPVSLNVPYEKVYMTPSQSSAKRLDIVLPARQAARTGIYEDTITVSISAR